MAEARLIFRSGEFVGQEVPLPLGVSRLGRSPENDIVIDDPSISSFHCELVLSDIALAIRDLGSTNGTFINQQRITKGVIQRGDKVTLGAIDFSPELPEVVVAIPELPDNAVAGAAFLGDGTPACYNHREVAATMRCTRCESWFCDACIREMKRLTGGILKFCPSCSAAVEAFPVYGPAKRKKSFFGRLQETWRLLGR